MAEQTERKTYCRACGENKGHNSSACKNASGLRQVITSQDQEIASLGARLETALEGARQKDDYERIAGLQSRIIQALLDLVEMRRKNG